MGLAKLLLLYDNETSIVAQIVKSELSLNRYSEVIDMLMMNDSLIKSLNYKLFIYSGIGLDFSQYDLTLFPSTSLTLERISLDNLRQRCGGALVCYGALMDDLKQANPSIDGLLEMPTFVSYEGKTRTEYVHKVIEKALENRKKAIN